MKTKNGLPLPPVTNPALLKVLQRLNELEATVAELDAHLLAARVLLVGVLHASGGKFHIPQKSLLEAYRTPATKPLRAWRTENDGATIEWTPENDDQL